MQVNDQPPAVIKTHKSSSSGAAKRRKKKESVKGTFKMTAYFKRCDGESQRSDSDH